MADHHDIPARFPEGRSLEADTGLWWVLQSRPNRELKLAKYLMQREIGYYLPLYNRRIRVGYFGREKITTGLLFKGYVCFALDRSEHCLLYETRDFARIIQIQEQNRFVMELQSLSKAIEIGSDLMVKPGMLKGRKVSVVGGPLNGVEGVIIGSSRNGKFAITVRMFNRTVIVNLDPSTDLEILQ